jgi:hypothetical protein
MECRWSVKNKRHARGNRTQRRSDNVSRNETTFKQLKKEEQTTGKMVLSIMSTGQDF